eukprot:468333_1
MIRRYILLQLLCITRKIANLTATVGRNTSQQYMPINGCHRQCPIISIQDKIPQANLSRLLEKDDIKCHLISDRLSKHCSNITCDTQCMEQHYCFFDDEAQECYFQMHDNQIKQSSVKFYINALFEAATNYTDLLSLYRFYYKGKILGCRNNYIPLNEETNYILQDLLIMNKHGIITYNSQPSLLIIDDNGYQYYQKNYVELSAPIDIVEKLLLYLQHYQFIRYSNLEYYEMWKIKHAMLLIVVDDKPFIDGNGTNIFRMISEFAQKHLEKYTIDEDIERKLIKMNDAEDIMFRMKCEFDSLLPG